MKDPGARPLGALTPMTASEVARALRWREADAREWLQEQDLGFLRPGGRIRLYLWGEVVDRIRGITRVPAPRLRPPQTFVRDSEL